MSYRLSRSICIPNCIPQTEKTLLLDRAAGFWKCNGNSFRDVACLLTHELAEPGSHVCLCDMDVVAGGHGGRTVTHEPGKGETVHAGLRGPRPKRVTPTVELERLEIGLLDFGGKRRRTESDVGNAICALVERPR